MAFQFRIFQVRVDLVLFYKGLLADWTEVAVKELKIGGGQGEHEFSADDNIGFHEFDGSMFMVLSTNQCFDDLRLLNYLKSH